MSEPRMLRPMEYGDLFNEAFDLFKRNFALLFGIGAIAYVPMALIFTAIFAVPSDEAKRLLFLLLMFPAALIVWWAPGAAIKALADRYLGKPITIEGAWRYVIRRAVPYSVTLLMAGVMFFLGLLALCVGWIFVAFWLAFLLPVMIVEERYFENAIRRSIDLAAGQWLRIFLIYLLSQLLYQVIYFVAYLAFLPVLLLPELLNPGAGTGAAGDVSALQVLVPFLMMAFLMAAVGPLQYILFVLLYFDVRVRKEGYDIELLAQEMSELPPGSGPSGAPA